MIDHAPPEALEFEVEANSSVRLDALVARHAALSRTQAATLIATGHVVVDGAREKAAYHPTSGQRVRVEFAPKAKRDITPQDLPLDVIFEDDELLVIDKSAGMVVHPAPGHWDGR